MPTRYVG